VKINLVPIYLIKGLVGWSWLPTLSSEKIHRITDIQSSPPRRRNNTRIDGGAKNKKEKKPVCVVEVVCCVHIGPQLFGPSAGKKITGVISRRVFFFFFTFFSSRFFFFLYTR
jgi:hypothetical protein